MNVTTILYLDPQVGTYKDPVLDLNVPDSILHGSGFGSEFLPDPKLSSYPLYLELET